MKKQKSIKFKRLLLRIASFIVIITILLSSFSVVALAKNAQFDSLSLYGYKGDYVMREFGVGHGYNSNPPSGTNGTILHRSTRYALKDNQFICYASNTPSGDIAVGITDIKNGIKFIYIQLQFNKNYYFYSGVNYSVSLPMQLVFYNYGTPSTENGIYGKIRQDKLSLIRHETDRNYYYDVWDITNISLTSDWSFTLEFNFTPGQDFDCNGMLFGFNFVPFVDSPGLGEIITSDAYMDPLTITPRPVYTMPDFTDQDLSDNLEGSLKDQGSSLFDAMDSYYKRLGSLGTDFSDLLKCSKAFSLLFDSYIGNGLLSLILNFSLLLGLSAFLISIIQSVSSFTYSVGTSVRRGGKK